MSDVVIKESKESVLGRRVFADKNFKEGETLLCMEIAASTNDNLYITKKEKINKKKKKKIK